MTQILLNQMLGTPGDASRECVGQGCANLVAGAFGSMGGCVTIGQAMINVGSGSKLRYDSVSQCLPPRTTEGGHLRYQCCDLGGFWADPCAFAACRVCGQRSCCS
jgi:hypothetical protein